ncbi:MAG: hypothetical protein M3301_03730 [Chloroflexota bacterium]|nr:hypothetical protein [Chloroflexota bacterium]
MLARRHVREVCAALILALVLGVPATAGQAVPAEAAAAYQLELYRRGDFVAQTNLVQCVGASMQMMINMMAPRDDRSAGTQRRLWLLARSYNADGVPNPRRRGASVRGWSHGLTQLGYGPYRVEGFPTRDAAVAAAAAAMRVTGKPVGLLVWGGKHAWVMSGFRATVDPLLTTSSRVTHVHVLDPLYPRRNGAWGPSPKPGSVVSLSTLGRYFVPRRRGRTGSLAGQYVVVLPVAFTPLQVPARALAI